MTRFAFKPANGWKMRCATARLRCASGIKAIAPGGCPPVLVGWRRQMTTTPGPEIGANLLKASYSSEDGETPAGFAVCSQDAGWLFSGNMATSLWPRRHCRKNFTRTASKIPGADAQGISGFVFCPHESDKNPFVAGPLKRTTARWFSDAPQPRAPPMSRLRLAGTARILVPRRRACCRTFADVQARTF